MKHVKDFNEFLKGENPNSDPDKEVDAAPAETPNIDSPADDIADDPKETPEEKPVSDTPASDVADEVEDDDDDDDDDVDEGNAFSGAVKKAKDAGDKEFEFKGKKFKVKEAKDIASFEDFISENFALYPTYNNMLGSEVMRNVPITHQVNMSVYGKENVVSGYGQPEPAALVVKVTVKEGEEIGEEQKYSCSNCGCQVGAGEVDQNPTKECPECSCTEWNPIENK